MKPLFTLILSLSLASTTGCGLMSSQSNKSEKVTQSDPFMQSLHSIDSALTVYRAEHEKAIYENSNDLLQSLDSTQDMQTCFNSAKNQWSQFVELCEKGKRKEALELYQARTEFSTLPHPLAYCLSVRHRNLVSTPSRVCTN